MRSTKLLSWSKRLLGLDAVPVPPHVFAVTSGGLSYGGFRRNGDGFELTEYRTMALEPDLFASGPLGGPLHDAERFRSVLAELQSALTAPVNSASLILPDAWLRLAIVESDELPRSAAARDEALRWKLQRTVPFRVEELRVRGLDSGSGPRAGDPRRVLLGFALESLLQQLETVFADRGVQIGLISNESLTLLSGMRDAFRDVELAGLAHIAAGGYSLTFLFRGEPLLHRFKALPQLGQDEPPRELIGRDLHLTGVYLGEQLRQTAIGRLMLVSPPDLESSWQSRLTEAFDLPVHPIRFEHLPLLGAKGDIPLPQLLTLLGGVRQEMQ